tara:strand:+ start:12559 stop:12729 length:171 start_codon:yes stop_codon:yes gene_type:complete
MSEEESKLVPKKPRAAKAEQAVKPQERSDAAQEPVTDEPERVKIMNGGHVMFIQKF